jgi:hypothetical protein
MRKTHLEEIQRRKQQPSENLDFSKTEVVDKYDWLLRTEGFEHFESSWL